MRPFIDRSTGLWKWGANGKPQYNTKEECSRAGLNALADKLLKVRDHIKRTAEGHGR
jgi:hypothetical protein